MAMDWSLRYRTCILSTGGDHQSEYQAFSIRLLRKELPAPSRLQGSTVRLELLNDGVEFAVRECVLWVAWAMMKLAKDL